MAKGTIAYTPPECTPLSDRGEAVQLQVLGCHLLVTTTRLQKGSSDPLSIDKRPVMGRMLTTSTYD